jgi:hypothetical protein
MAHELAHVTQESAGPVRRDLAIPAPNAGAVPVVLTPRERLVAQTYNRRRFEDPFSIAIIRDVMGVSKYPAQIDDTFLDGLVRWQADHNLTQDGKFGPATTQTFLDELVAEGRQDLADLVRGDNFVRVVNVQGPTFNLPNGAAGGFGGFRWDVSFNSSLRNGFIVQRVESVRNQNPAPPPGFAPAAPRYWEAWSVDGGGNVSPVMANGSHDTWQRGLFNGSTGTWSIRGTLYTVLNLPAQFDPQGGANHAAAAGTLRSALNLSAANIDALGLPEGFAAIELGDEGARRIGGTFNFTGAPATHTHTRT